MITKIQDTLDNALAEKRIYSYWKRKSKTSGADESEYIVYTIDGDAAQYADDKPIIRNANIAIRYYYKDSLIETAVGRLIIQARIEEVIAALEAAGFSVPFGPFDAGDIDDIGYGTTIIECYYGRVV